MIKLKELLSLREMVYTHQVKPKHKDKMNRETKILEHNTFATLQPPPDNDSNTTLNEINKLAKIEPDKKRVERGDNVKELFYPLIKEIKSVDKEHIDLLIKDSAKYIFKLKYQYNRPRPYQVAEFYDIDLNGTQLDSMKTPSYPSGHATQGYLIAEYLCLKDPHNETLYRSVGEEIAESRIIAKAHYPSDKIAGKYLANQLIKFII
tara:strand:- start:361 stop:978 length:618 start_codon:yes stop_codon:yes gene_type:complete